MSAFAVIEEAPGELQLDEGRNTTFGDEMFTTDTTEADMTEAEWIDAHPEVRAAAPHWATEIAATTEPDDTVALDYDWRGGAVEFGIVGSWDRGVIRLEPSVSLYFRENECDVTAADLRRYAADFTAAADALDGAPQNGANK